MQHHHCHAHETEVRPESLLQRVISAALMEFGVSVHSVLIGVAVGVVPDDEVRILLIALSFHQFFEGLALGARLVDATYRGVLEAILALVFSLSASFGMAIGVGLMATKGINLNGSSYLLVTGIFDSVCCGILLYLGFQLLLHDFASDLRRYCDRRGVAHGGARRVAMFGGLWVGAGVLAFIGKYA
jgi:zinc transporter 1/2/3